MLDFKSILKPENSVIAGIATAGSVWAIYQMNTGNTVTAHASDPNHPALETSRKKAVWSSFIFVSAITLITRDSNVGLLGYASIIAIDFNTRHAIMAHPVTGQIMPPAESSYAPAGGNVIDFSQAGANAPMTGYTG
jgi:hypothetical protein